MDDIVREARTGRRVSFSSDYTNYTVIFYHRSMEKDKLFVLNVWSAYGQKFKNIQKLDCSEINERMIEKQLKPIGLTILTSKRSRRISRDNLPPMSDEGHLISELLSRYRSHKTLARPVINSNSTVFVQFGLSLIQILDLDEKNQMLTTLVWKEYKWQDEFLTWDPYQYGGVDTVRLPRNKVWTPDIILYNNIDARDIEDHKEMLLVFHNGSIVWIPPVIYKSSCQVNMADFPFDIQTCELRFGSWTYDSNKLDLIFLRNRLGFNLEGYVPHSEWEILNHEGTRNVLAYACCDSNNYTDLTFSVTLKRRVTFHMRLILIPTVLLSAMSLAIFWIPANRPDRTSLGLSLFSSFFLLLILIVNSSPPTAHAKLGRYCCISILMVATGTILSVLIINLSQSRRPVPQFLEMLILQYLARLCCPCDFTPFPTPSPHDRSATIPLADGGGPNAQDLPLTMRKWRCIGTVLDRIFFTCFVICLVCTFVLTFPKPENMLYILS